VLIPGIQGRWEFMRPTVDALSTEFRVLPFSLRHDASSLDDYVAQVIDILDANGVARAVVCGVSFGGLVAIRCAARYPHRVSALVLASVPPSLMNLRRRHRLYARFPWIFGPLFLVETPWRLRAELVAALPSFVARCAFKWRVVRTALVARISLRRMAARAALMSTTDVRPDCAHVAAPTLVVTGEAHLDHVVPVTGTMEYTRLIPGARASVLERTGHTGTMTRPDAFTDMVRRFIAECGLRIADSGATDAA
jgi:3-oxoadipate enol-lactonase